MALLERLGAAALHPGTLDNTRAEFTLPSCRFVWLRSTTLRRSASHDAGADAAAAAACEAELASLCRGIAGAQQLRVKGLDGVLPAGWDAGGDLGPAGTIQAVSQSCHLPAQQARMPVLAVGWSADASRVRPRA